MATDIINIIYRARTAGMQAIQKTMNGITGRAQAMNSNLDMMTQHMMAGSKQLGIHQGRMNRITAAQGRMVPLWQSITGGIQNANERLQNMGMNARNLQMGFLSVGLSMLFTGMAIKRFLQNILKSMLSLYMKMEGEQGALSERVNQLKARLFNMVYGVIDAAKREGVFAKWEERINALINYVNRLDDETKASIVNWMIWGVIGATAMMVIGQALLGLIPIVLLIGSVSSKVFWKWVGVIGLVGLAVKALSNTFDSEGSKIEKSITGVIGGLAAAGAAILAGFSPGAIILGTIIATLGILIWKFGSVEDAAYGLALAFGKAGAFILDVLKTAVLSPLRVIIDSINGVIRLRNKLKGRPLDEGTISVSSVTGLPAWMDKWGLSENVDKKRNQFLRKELVERREKPSDLQRFTDILTGKRKLSLNMDFGSLFGARGRGGISEDNPFARGFNKKNSESMGMSIAEGLKKRTQPPAPQGMSIAPSLRQMPTMTSLESFNNQFRKFTKDKYLTAAEVRDLVGQMPNANTFYNEFNLTSGDTDELARKIVEKQEEMMSFFQGAVDSDNARG